MAKRYLEISEELRIPAAEFTTQTIVVYGGKGMGKTNLAAVAAEELAACGQRFALLDPVGVSWGLRHGAGGRGKGLEILILGGLHGDLPIEPTGGGVVADLVADEDADVLIDISRRADGQMWSNAEKLRFVTEYATRLYQRQGERRRPLMQMIDEAGRFVPQDIPRGAEHIAACVGAIEQLVELGRNVGVGVMLITQRSARMKKSVSELAECMIAFRTVGPRSVDAILDWFGEHVEKEHWKDLVAQLRTLPRGHALVVSPGWLEYEGVAAIRKRATFDSSSTPTGEERKLAARGARPDLDKYRARIAETVEKAEATDPSKLRQKLQATTSELALVREKIARLEAKPSKAAPEEVRTLKMQLARTRRALEAAMKFVIKVQAYRFDAPEDREALEQAVAAAVGRVVDGIERRVVGLADKVENLKKDAARLEKDAKALLETDVDLSIEVHRRQPYDVREQPAPKAPRRPADAPAEGTVEGVDRYQADVLTALAKLHALGLEDAPKPHVAALANKSHRSSTWDKKLAGLAKAGLLEYTGGGMKATPAGLAAVPEQPPATGREILDGYRGILTDYQRALFEALIQEAHNGGESITREELAERAGKSRTSSTFDKEASGLRAVGVLEVATGGRVKLAERLARFV